MANTKRTDEGIYNLFIWTPQRTRGKYVGSFTRYKHLVAYAQRVATIAGYPKSRWCDLYDWNKESR